MSRQWKGGPGGAFRAFEVTSECYDILQHNHPRVSPLQIMKTRENKNIRKDKIK